MPLPPPAEREPIQTRAIEVSSYRRADGQWDVEGRLVDTASYGFPNRYRGEIAAGEPIHDMNIRLTVNQRFEITDVAAAMDATPYAACPGAEPAFQKLIGERIGPGWNRRLRDLLGGANGCVHVVDLLRPVGTVGFKTVAREAGQQGVAPALKTDDLPYQINSCHALASDGDIVRERWPEHYTGE